MDIPEVFYAVVFGNAAGPLLIERRRGEEL
jgi:hypothetical protein